MTNETHRAPVTALLAAIVLYAIIALWLGAYSSGDAFVDYRYARHLAAGDGLVYNSGESATEGYRSLLWVACGAAFTKAGLAPHTALPYATMLLGVLVLIVVWDVFRIRRERPLIAFVVLVTLATAAPFVAACGSGTDAALFALALVWFAWAVERSGARPSPSWLAVLVLATTLCVLCRVEGILVVPFALLALLRREDGGGTTRAGVVAAVAIAVIVLGYHAWRITTLDGVVPNAVEIRAGRDLDALFSSDHSAAAYGLVYVCAFGVSVAGYASSRRPREAAAGFLPVVLAVLYLGLDDATPAHGNHAALLPLAAVLWPTAVARLGEVLPASAAGVRRPRFWSPLALAFLAAAVGLAADLRIEVHRVAGMNAGTLRPLGEWVARWFPEEAIASEDPAIPYFAGTRAIDIRPRSVLGAPGRDRAEAVSRTNPVAVFLPSHGFNINEVTREYIPFVRASGLKREYRQVVAVRMLWEDDRSSLMLLRKDVPDFTEEMKQDYPLGIDGMRRWH